MPTNPDARKVLENMFAAYANCKTYQDTGIAECHGNRISFKTFFSRPNRLYVEFSGPDQPRTVVWCNGGKSTKTNHEHDYIESYYWDESDGNIEVDDLGMSLAGATGVSYGGASTVPGFLFPNKAYGIAYKNAQDFVLLPSEKVDEQVCDVLSSKEWNLKVWISKNTHLMIRETTQVDKIEFKIDFDPSVNKKIPVSQYNFTPPKK